MEKTFLIFGLFFVLISACKKENSATNENKTIVLYQSLDKKLIKEGFALIDIDKDSKDDYKIELFHKQLTNIYSTDTFFVKFYPLQIGYTFLKKENDNCFFKVGDIYSGQQSNDTMIISSYFVKTGVEGQGDKYICTTRQIDDNSKVYFHNGWIRLSINKTRDTINLFDCAYETGNYGGIKIGQKESN
ncbi:MAG: hypothetical protein GX179_04585 [Candidatus Cloacimonetes bacterium]|jgi:hypothetical protein|nr:hypothetical protein [Candidatus Cloacimonadota bacterium]